MIPYDIVYVNNPKVSQYIRVYLEGVDRVREEEQYFVNS